MSWLSIAVLSFQICLLLCFAFFAYFNYLYGFAALRRPRIAKAAPSNRPVAVVIVSYNEKYVLPETLKQCERLIYPNKLIVLSDDSNDPDIIDDLRTIAAAQGCRRAAAGSIADNAEVWESAAFVYFHRPTNEGFKGGNLRQVAAYLRARDYDLMYLLDADWHPQPDAIERALETLEADTKTAFVQTKRITFEHRMRLFQKYVALSEEGCYYVDFEGRESIGHPILFSGCCTLLRLDAVDSVGGFASGHLTEDLDVTNRLWLAGWNGAYRGDVINHGEVPFTYDDFRRQQERWACGTARCFREYFWPLLRCRHLTLGQKLSAIRQNAYFATSLLASIAILQGMATVAWLILGSGSFAVDYYLYLVSRWRWPLVITIYTCVLSSLIEYLVMILGKKRSLRDLIHMPMGIWYAWSVLIAVAQGTLKGFFNVKLDWFRTPKYLRNQVGVLSRMPPLIRVANAVVCLVLVAFYFAEGWFFGWRDPFALLLLPAFILGAIE